MGPGQALFLPHAIARSLSAPITFRLATLADAPTIVRLVNGAYRGEGDAHGWTSERDLVTGARTDARRLAALLARPSSVVLVAEREGKILGCVHLQRDDASDACELGMFSVDIREQAAGIGRALLARAEWHARDAMGARTMVMHVVSIRSELLAYYERRGYRRTGRLQPFVPRNGEGFLRGPLSFERLERPLV